MKSLWLSVRKYAASAWEAWNGFWFSPSDPATLSLIRLFAGAMLFYTHFIWTFDLIAFFGPNGWLPLDFYSIERGYVPEDAPTTWLWSLFQHFDSTSIVWCIHIFALLVFFCLMVGFFSRTAAVLGAFLAIMYAARVTPGAFFGLDKINCFLALYLMLGPCGARYSIDRLWRVRRGSDREVMPSVSANIAIRLMQWHLAIVYLFSGLGKLQGMTWWTGEATWLSIASVEYQSLNVTFLAHYPWLMDLLAHVTVFWEVFYCVLIWNRWARPWMLVIALGVHGFIATCMGMMTFGTIMLIANLAFVSPSLIRRVADPLARRVTLALTGDGAGQGSG